MSTIVTPAWAAAPPHIVESDVRIGFRSVQNKGQSRNGVWAPVQVTLKAGADDITRDSYRLVVETTDGEAVPYVYSVPVPAIPANGEQIVFAYVRPGSDGATFLLKLQKADGQDVQTLRLQRDPSSTQSEIIGPRDVLYLTVGARLPALKSALRHPEKPGVAGEVAEEPEEGGAQRFAFVENVAGLPDRWFGYEGVDVVVLATASDAFVNQLLEMSKSRRDALLDWVRRGGRLVLSVGRNQPSVARWLERVPLADVALKGKITRAALRGVQIWSGPDQQQQKQPLRQVEIACIQPGPNAHALVLADKEGGDPKQWPIVLQSSCGLGRVLLVAFDLDAPPFSTWEGQPAFWKKLHGEIAPHVGTLNADQPVGPWGQGGELGMDLKRGLETFEEVPVISFGWVALFILFYIALVGPLDYLVLKKVFKRLELTWITFPILVVIVSVAAYATAYYVKGDDLRINKIDLVDIDMHGPGQVYGRTWFTLFSPRIQNYTAGLEPVAPEWGGRWDADDADAPSPPVMVATLEGAEAELGGNSQSLFRRPYEYADDAGGLRRVPIPVWATRTFTASWRAPLKDRAADRPPPIKAELRISRANEEVLSGAITNNLPAELQEIALFYRGKWYLLGDLMPGEARDVNPLFEGNVKKHELLEWLDPGWAPSTQRTQRPLRRLMFHDLPGGTEQPASGLRTLDESWRLQLQGGERRHYREEVVLVGHTPPRSDRAETVTKDGVSPTRLWLDELPGTQSQRPALSGYFQQETYVRIYIPLVRSR